MSHDIGYFNYYYFSAVSNRLIPYDMTGCGADVRCDIIKSFVQIFSEFIFLEFLTKYLGFLSVNLVDFS